MAALVTDEDKPIIEAMIKKLVRYRKREHAFNKKHASTDLDDAIKSLREYGALKGWWEFDK